MTLLPWLLVACGGTPPAEPEPLAEPVGPEPPALVVLVVIDQFPTRALEAVAPYLDGGLARLVGPQAWQATGRHTHAVTYTCPGHATLATGASPLGHGVVSNSWRVDGEGIYCIDADLPAELVGGVFAAGGGRIAAVSLKDRAAYLLGSPEGDLVAWYQRDPPGWKAFRGQAPTPPEALQALLASPWEAAHDYGATFEDDQPFELDLEGLGRTFPRPPLVELGDDAFLVTPHAGRWVTDGALAAIDALALGQDGAPDLLAVGYSQVDECGHVYTAESWEYLDALVGVDRDLARLMEALDERVGEGRWSLVVTGDHGAAVNPRRIDRTGLRADLAAHLAELGFPEGTYFSHPHVWLPPEVSGEERERMARAAADYLAAVDGIAWAWPWRLEGGLPDDAPHVDAIRLTLHPDRAGDVYVIPEPRTIFASKTMAEGGTRHGTPYDEDALVPVLAYGAGVPAGRAVAEVDVRQVAPTLTALAGLRAPAQAELPALDWAVRSR